MTYDDAGNVIPLSERFNPRKSDIRWSMGGQVAAERLGISMLPDAERMEADGASREDIWRRTGWWKAKDGRWRVELPDVDTAEIERRLNKRLDSTDGYSALATKLGEVVPDIAKVYPEAANVMLDIVVNPEAFSGDRARGSYTPAVSRTDEYFGRDPQITIRVGKIGDVRSFLATRYSTSCRSGRNSRGAATPPARGRRSSMNRTRGYAT